MTLRKIFPFLSWMPIAKKHWKDDLIAGLTGTIIVIPQAVAFALIAGLPPVYGFYTAMISPIIAALFGSSYHLISGPTTTSSIVLYAVISTVVPPSSDIEAFISLAIVLSFMAGVIKLVMGFAKMGIWSMSLIVNLNLSLSSINIAPEDKGTCRIFPD